MAIEGARPGGDGTDRPLGVIVFVNADTLFRRDGRREHFQQVELRCHLKQSARVDLVRVWRLDIRDHFTERKLSLIHI